MPVFGPGTLQIGETGSEIDASCLVNSLRITAGKDEGDATTKLCGTVKPGKVTYTYSLTGNVDIDSEVADGLFALSQASPGTEVPFTFTPNTPTETSAAGTVVLDPLDFGGDEYGEDMNSDIEFAIVGAPTYTYPEVTPDPAVAGVQRFARVVQNGKPGQTLTDPVEREVPTSSKTTVKTDEPVPA